MFQIFENTLKLFYLSKVKKKKIAGRLYLLKLSKCFFQHF